MDYMSKLINSVHKADYFAEEVVSVEGNPRTNWYQMSFLVCGERIVGNEILKAIAQRVKTRDESISVFHINMTDLMNTYNEQKDGYSWRKRYSPYELLLIDNFNEVVENKQIQHELLHLLDWRFECGKYTAISSTLTPKELFEKGCDMELIYKVNCGIVADLSA